jgi:hypothetical protein
MKSLINFIIILWIINLPLIVALLSHDKDKNLHYLEIGVISLSSFLFMISYLFYKRSLNRNSLYIHDPHKAKVLLSFSNLFHLILLLFYIQYAIMKTSFLFISTVSYLSLPLFINIIEIVSIHFTI